LEGLLDKKNYTQNQARIKIKNKISNSTVIPVLTYGSQTWATTKKQLSKLQKNSECDAKKHTRGETRRGDYGIAGKFQQYPIKLASNTLEVGAFPHKIVTKKKTVI